MPSLPIPWHCAVVFEFASVVPDELAMLPTYSPETYSTNPSQNQYQTDLEVVGANTKHVDWFCSDTTSDEFLAMSYGVKGGFAQEPFF